MAAKKISLTELKTLVSTIVQEQGVKKNVNKVILTLTDNSLKKFKTIPTFKEMLYPNQLASLKVGDNELSVNNTILGKLQRMAGPGGYSVSKK